MSLVPFDTLPDEARLWCFGASRPPDPTETTRLLEAMRAFADRWTAHRRDLHAALEWRGDRFLLVAVDESASTGASGCSIDALTSELRRLEEELRLDLLDATPVWYRERDGSIASCSREEFRTRASRGEVDESTPVFDVALTRVGDLRAAGLERPAGGSWHRRLLARS